MQVWRARAGHVCHHKTISSRCTRAVSETVDGAIRIMIVACPPTRTSTSDAPVCLAARMARARSACVMLAGRPAMVATEKSSYRRLGRGLSKPLSHGTLPSRCPMGHCLSDVGKAGRMVHLGHLGQTGTADYSSSSSLPSKRRWTVDFARPVRSAMSLMDIPCLRRDWSVSRSSPHLIGLMAHCSPSRRASKGSASDP